MRSRDPSNGDVTYTEGLLANPPDGVEYVPYDEALAAGDLVERFRRAPGERVREAIRDDPDRWSFMREAVINKLRRRDAFFREPFRFFRVSPGRFDVAHVHVFNVSLGPTAPPIVVSNSVQVDAVYRDGRGRSAALVAAQRWADERLAAQAGVVHAAFDHRGAAATVCFSEFLKQRFVAELGRTRRGSKEYVVIPPAVEPAPPPVARDAQEDFHVGFIGDWKAKGGDVVLEAFRRLVADGVPARLTVVGTEPMLGRDESTRLGVSWSPRLPRDQLLQVVIPSLSALAYPTRFDGLPLTVLEVMARGVPPVVSEYGALPEVVDFGRSGMVVPPDDPARLAAALRVLRDDPARRAQLSAAARETVTARNDPARTAAALGAVYERVAASKACGT